MDSGGVVQRCGTLGANECFGECPPHLVHFFMAHQQRNLQAVHFIYNKLEVGPRNLLFTSILLVGVPAVSSTALIPHFPSPLLGSLFTFALFYSTLSTSIICYRLSPFHPLASYPGPKHLRISKWTGLWHASSGRQHVYFKELHEKYGAFVRTGEVSRSLNSSSI